MRPDRGNTARRELDVEKRLADIERDMDRRLTFAEHIYGQIIEFDCTGDDTAIRVTTRFQSPPVGVLLLKCTNLDNPRVPGACIAAWDPVDGGVEFYNFAGLASGVKYRTRWLVIGG